MVYLFRATMEVFIILTVAGFTASCLVGAKRSESPARLADTKQQPKTPQPGTGGSAVIALEANAGQVEIDGHHVPLSEFLEAKDTPETVVLKLKGPQWQQLTDLVRKRDLHFVVETQP